MNDIYIIYSYLLFQGMQEGFQFIFIVLNHYNFFSGFTAFV